MDAEAEADRGTRKRSASTDEDNQDGRAQMTSITSDHILIDSGVTPKPFAGLTEAERAAIFAQFQAGQRDT